MTPRLGSLNVDRLAAASEALLSPLSHSVEWYSRAARLERVLRKLGVSSRRSVRAVLTANAEPQ